MDETRIIALIKRMTSGFVEELTRMILKKVQDVLDAYRPNMDRATGVLPPGSGGTGGTSGSAFPKGPAGGDLNGTYPNPTVDGLQGRPVDAAAPADGDALVWQSGTWAPGATSLSGPAGGDLSGTYPDPTVDGLQGRSVAGTAPTTGQALLWGGSQWAPGDVAAIGPTFPSPTLPGQMLVSLDGATWTPVFILTDPESGVLLGENGEILVGA